MTTTESLVRVTDATFDELVLRSELPVLLEFTASWCPPCRMIEPVLRELAGELAGRVVVAQLDVDENPRTASAYGVLGMPTLNLYRDGAVVARLTGARPKAALLRAFGEHLPAVG
ncbi:thioredoxin family protein [Pseudonocardia lacus]|uniref:thioredoxin family protein n=1 Tax=Pseudonocardia lacus TaxID=2835865 RepID=UPI0027397629|nr:thioredoxin [Pseudonocardia lacus]